jgi:hypothetical protein
MRTHLKLKNKPTPQSMTSLTIPAQLIETTTELDFPLMPAGSAPVTELRIRAHPYRCYSVARVQPPAKDTISWKPFGRLHETIRKIRRKAENRRIILAVKAEGCWLCGRKDFPVTDLHFHHLDPKTKKGNIADLVTRSTRALVEEISKCRLICVEDHKKHHAILKSEVWRTGGCYDL